MSASRKIFAVVPVKELAQAKQRLAGELSAAARQNLARTMLEDVLTALAATPELAGILVVTVDETAAALARQFGAEITADGARGGAHLGGRGRVSHAREQKSRYFGRAWRYPARRAERLQPPDWRSRRCSVLYHCTGSRRAGLQRDPVLPGGRGVAEVRHG